MQVAFIDISILFSTSFINNCHRGEKAASCLLPNTCLGIATRIIAKFESLEVGLTWSRVGSSPSADDDFSFAYVLGMFIVQSIIYGIITWYVTDVW